jgi:hypothetical protein
MYNKQLSHSAAQVIFKQADKPEGQPDFVSESGSAYWYTNQGVYRASNHWGNVASCDWGLDGVCEANTPCVVLPFEICGFALWSDFTASSTAMDINAYMERMNANTKELAKSAKATAFTSLFAQHGIITASQKEVFAAFGYKGKPDVVRQLGLQMKGKKVVPVCI